MNYTFGEKKTEYYKGEQLPVWKSPKYEQSKAKAIEIIENGKYGIKEGDFWILMNSTKNKQMAYTGLIISHNGCLKINDGFSDEEKFRPECLSIDINGYNNSLVYPYCCPEQKIYEVGEVSASNCKNDYPYAMALKRCFDRAVLKISKLAFDGIYSDSEADEFKQKDEDTDNTDYEKSLLQYIKDKPTIALTFEDIANEYRLNKNSTQADLKKAYDDLVKQFGV